jgi:hypothetical protein
MNLTYKKALKKLDKYLTNLQCSIDNEEWFFVYEDRIKLSEVLTELDKKIEKNIVSSIEEKKYKDEYVKLKDEVFFYLNLASEELSDNMIK